MQVQRMGVWVALKEAVAVWGASFAVERASTGDGFKAESGAYALPSYGRRGGSRGLAEQSDRTYFSGNVDRISRGPFGEQGGAPGRSGSKSAGPGYLQSMGPLDARQRVLGSEASRRGEGEQRGGGAEAAHTKNGAAAGLQKGKRRPQSEYSGGGHKGALEKSGGFAGYYGYAAREPGAPAEGAQGYRQNDCGRQEGPRSREPQREASRGEQACEAGAARQRERQGGKDLARGRVAARPGGGEEGPGAAGKPAATRQLKRSLSEREFLLETDLDYDFDEENLQFVSQNYERSQISAAKAAVEEAELLSEKTDRSLNQMARQSPAPAPACGEPIAPSLTPDQHDFNWPGPLLVVGDLHGDYFNTFTLLRGTNLIDAHGNWSGGNTCLVQMGDITDRGPDCRDIYRFLCKLRLQAPKAGGKVVLLPGNHDIMRLQQEFRYAHPQEFETFGGHRAMRAAFSAEGECTKVIQRLPLLVRINGIVFVHAGVSVQHASYGAYALRKAWSSVASQMPIPKAQNCPHGTAGSLLGAQGPLWIRAYKNNSNCAELSTALRFLEAEKMVVGHTRTTDGSIETSCNGQIIFVDTWITAYGGEEFMVKDPKALYIEGRFFYQVTVTGEVRDPNAYMPSTSNLVYSQQVAKLRIPPLSCNAVAPTDFEINYSQYPNCSETLSSNV